MIYRTVDEMTTTAYKMDERRLRLMMTTENGCVSAADSRPFLGSDSTSFFYRCYKGGARDERDEGETLSLGCRLGYTVVEG